MFSSSVCKYHWLMDLSREEETMMGELSFGVAIEVTMSVCILILSRRTILSAMVELLDFRVCVDGRED